MTKLEITLGERVFTVRPMSRKIFREFATQIGQMESGALRGAAAVAVMFDIVYAAIKQDLPDFSEAEYDTIADTGNVQGAYYAVMTGSLPPKQGEAPASQ